MSHVEIHHFQIGLSRRSKAMLVKPVPESERPWPTYFGCGHFHRSDDAAERCARATWPDVAEPANSE